MLERWWKEPFIDTNVYLLTQYQNLKMDAASFLIVLMLQQMLKTEKSIDHKKLAEMLKMEENACREAIAELISDGWIEMKVTNKTVSYSLDPIYLKKPVVNIPKTLFALFEEHFARPLTATEMNKLSEWMNMYDTELIEWGLRKAVVYKQVGFSYIGKILNKWHLNGVTVEMLNEGKE